MFNFYCVFVAIVHAGMISEIFADATLCHCKTEFCTETYLCPVPPPCPPQVYCPPRICPPPPSCPLPPPPPSCPPCTYQVISERVLVKPHAETYLDSHHIIEHSCCPTCTTPCYARIKRNILLTNNSIDQFSTNAVNITLPIDDPLCNNKELLEIIRENVNENSTESQQLIRDAAETKLGGLFHVLCSKGNLSFTAFPSADFCQHQKGQMICYAFKFKDIRNA